MKKFFFNILFFISLLHGQMVIAGCGELCSDIWWSKATLADLKIYVKDQEVVNKKDPYGFSPLHFAVSNNSPQKVELLLSLGANVNAKSHYGFTPIFHAVGQTGDLRIIHLLLEAGANVNVKNRDGITPLHYAAWGSADKIERLLKAGATPNVRSKSGRTPYDMALENEELIGSDVLRALIEAVTD